MKFSRGFLPLLALLLLTSAAFAQNVVGKWKGKIDVSQVKAKDAQQQKMLDQIKPMLASMKAVLDLKADHTYAFEMSGGPGGQSQKENGKWTQAGRTVTVIDPKGKKQKMVLSADGKTMVNTPNAEDNAPKGIKLIFMRA